MLHRLLSAAYFQARLPGGLSYLKKAESLYHGSREALERYQEEKYRKLLLYAYRHTAYYRELFDGIGLIRNGEIRPEKLDEIPVMDKETVRREKKRLLSDEAEQRGAYSHRTSGSTGTPLELWHDRHYVIRNRADKLLMGVLNGRYPGDRELKLWAVSIGQKQTGKDKDRFFNFFTNRSVYTVYAFNDEEKERIIRQINDWKPVQIWTIPSVISEVAKYAQQHGMKLHVPHDIIMTSGTLYEEMRALLQEVFPGALLIDQYGSNEFGVVACSVGESRELRVFDHSARIEIADAAGNVKKEGTGDIILTGLNNYCMPLIRYRMDDAAVISSGGGTDGSFSVIKQLLGRKTFLLRRRDGSYVLSLSLMNLFRKDWIRQFQVIQHSHDDLEVILAIDGEPDQHKQDLQFITDTLNHELGTVCRFSFPDEIPTDNFGKFQFIKTELE